MTSIPYVWSDAWLLLSVLLAGSTGAGATLEDIVAAGDAINHAIFTFYEIDGGLARLLAGGLVRIHGERVSPTLGAVAIYDRVHESRGSLLTQMEGIGRKIGAPRWSASHDPNRGDPIWSSKRFSRADFKRAYSRYKRKFATALRKREQQGR